MWLFKFPLFFTTTNRVARSAAMASFVVVFPALPVIAMTFVATAVRTACARRCSASSVSGTSIVLASSCTRPRSTIAPAAPPCEHVGDERMSVEPRSAQRHEEIPGLQRPAVGDNITNRTIGAVLLPRRAHCGGDPTERQVERRHTARDFSRRDANASLATSTSSNENV